MIALTGGQELVFAIVGLIAVIVLCVLPTSRRPPPPKESTRRLMKELDRHEEQT